MPPDVPLPHPAASPRGDLNFSALAWARRSPNGPRWVSASPVADRGLFLCADTVSQRVYAKHIGSSKFLLGDHGNRPSIHVRSGPERGTGHCFFKARTIGPLKVARSRIEFEPSMKLIIAIVQPSKLDAIKEALTRVEVHRLTVVDCQGFGRQRGQTGSMRGRDYGVNLLRKVQLQIGVNEEFVQPTIDAILEGGRSGDSGEIGDGKIFVLPMDDCVRIRTGERGGEAI